MTGRGLRLRSRTRVGLVGSIPYHRDLVFDWLHDAACVESITVMVGGRRRSRPGPRASNGSDDDIDLVVGVIDDRDDPALGSCRRLTGAGRTRPFVAVLVVPDPQVLQASVDAGAAGIIAATSGATALARAIATVAEGAAWLDPAVSPLVINRMWQPLRDDGFGLTTMQRRVAACLGDGLTNREIGDRLGIGEETVKSHVSNILRKLDVCDRVAAAAVLRREPNQAMKPAVDPGRSGTRAV